MAADQKIKIIQYTDPLCTWCYGMEPAMRKIEYLLGDKVEIVSGLEEGQTVWYIAYESAEAALFAGAAAPEDA